MGMETLTAQIGKARNRLPFGQSLKHSQCVIPLNAHFMAFKISLLKNEMSIETRALSLLPFGNLNLLLGALVFCISCQPLAKGKLDENNRVASCGWLVYTQITKSDYKFVNAFACRERPVLLMAVKLNYPVHFYSKRKTDPCSLVSLHNVDV